MTRMVKQADGANRGSSDPGVGDLNTIELMGKALLDSIRVIPPISGSIASFKHTSACDDRNT